MTDPTAEPGERCPLPTFIVIGAQKCATRWLRINLGQHPQIFTAGSELHFWNNGNRVKNLGTDWYRDQFEGWSGEPIIGEATPELRARTYGAYYLIRDCVVTAGSFLGAWLWSLSPQANFAGAAVCGALGTIWYWRFVYRRPAPAATVRSASTQDQPMQTKQ